MPRLRHALAATTLVAAFIATLAPDRAWNGYTVLSPLGTQAVIVIDMNGNVVKRWDNFNNSAGGPARVLPGGHVIAPTGARPPHQESLALVQRDFAGTNVWEFSRAEQIETPPAAGAGRGGPGRGGPPGPGRQGGPAPQAAQPAAPTGTPAMIWSARQHHDWQRENFPAGYYSPEYTPAVQGSNTLILSHANRTQPKVADGLLEDDRIFEVDWNGKILWDWIASDHVDEFGFSPEARQAIRGGSGAGGRGGPARGFDWVHINSATYLGPNRWFDAGDKRFAPNHVMISSREANFLAIIARDGSIVWRLGPDFTVSPETRAIRQMIGQHHAHLIPKGLPGAGNLLVFDNGGAAGYGPPNPVAPTGRGTLARPTSRVLEINPVTLELVWSYTNPRFFSTNISGAQRLVNGNTLITAGAGGRLFEVTREGAIVWEYIYPPAAPNAANTVYRAYRVPFDWIPQLTAPQPKRVTPPPLGEFRVP
jgi:hypothetical protein